jgi:hypothetical protein
VNVEVEWLAFLLRIREVPGSNLRLETDCPDRFVVVPSVPPDKLKDSTSNEATTTSFHIVTNS